MLPNPRGYRLIMHCLSIKNCTIAKNCVHDTTRVQCLIEKIKSLSKTHYKIFKIEVSWIVKNTKFVFRHTGCDLKNWTHSFNHKCSHDRNPSNFRNSFICYHAELSFEVYNSFLGQLA